MKNIFNVIFFWAIITCGNAQVSYVKTTVVETINSQQFYIHEVTKGQTLFSLAKLYAVSINDIYTYNTACRTNYSIGDKLKIPVKAGEQVVQSQMGNTNPNKSVSKEVKNKKSTVNNDFVLGKEKMELKNYNEAASYFTRALESSQIPEAYFLRGRIYFLQEKYQEAEFDYSKYVSLNPSDANGFNDLGSTKRKLNDVEGALVNYLKAVEIDPTLDFVYDNIGSVHLMKGDTSAAMIAFSKTIQLNQKNYFALNNRGNIKFAQNDFKGAKDDFFEAIKMNPQFSNAYNNSGSVKVKLNDFYGAVTDLSKAIELNPNYGSAFLNRGIAYDKLEQTSQACNDWLKAKSLGVNIAEKYISKQCR